MIFMLCFFSFFGTRPNTKVGPPKSNDITDTVTPGLSKHRIWLKTKFNLHWAKDEEHHVKTEQEGQTFWAKGPGTPGCCRLCDLVMFIGSNIDFNFSMRVSVYAECIYVFLSKSCYRRCAEYHIDCWQTLQWRLLWRISGATNWSQK